MAVPLLDLSRQYAYLKPELDAACIKVLTHGKFILGPEVAELEKQVAAVSNVKYGIGVASGTDALLLALRAAGVEPGDEVITTNFSFFATAGVVHRLGAKPVLVDIEPDSYNIDPKLIEKAITKKTKVIMPVHLFGQMADMDPIMAVAAKHNLYVIEDAAQAIGAVYKGRRAGSIGTVGCFSFFPSKNLGGAGDGGMATVQDPRLGERLATFRNHGAHSKYDHHFVGGNFRLDTIQAAYLLIKLKHLDDWSAKRRANAALYDALLGGIEPVVTPVIAPHNVAIYNQYVLRVERRDALRQHLSEHGVGTAIYYPLSLHEQECFRELGYRRGDFPHSERAAAETLAIPIYPELSDEQIRYVADTIRGFYAGRGAA